MNTTYDSYSDVEDITRNISNKDCDVSISDALAGLRISALTKAAKMSPNVKEVTIGPRSPLKKEIVVENHQVEFKQESEENLLEDIIRKDLRYLLIMREHQAQLQETSEILCMNLIEKMMSRKAETAMCFGKMLSDECQRRAMEYKARKVQLLKELQNNDNLKILEMAKLDEQRNPIIHTQTLENMNRILEEQNKATARFASITDSHTKICICYNNISNILNTEPLAKDISNKYITSINTVIGNISVIMDLCKTGTVTDKEAKQAEVLAINIDNIKKKILNDLKEIKQQKLIQKQQEEELQRKEIEKKKAQEIKAAEIAQVQKAAPLQANKIKPTFYSIKNYEYFKQLSEFLHQYEGQYKELLENANLKKFRFDCQKAVNTPVNALSSVSGSHIKDKYEKLYKLLKGERVQVLDIYVTATQHPQGLAYCTALLAKKIVRQGDLVVSSNPDAAFPLASVTVALWSQFPEFGKLLEAYFHRQCPYLVPMLLPQKEGQSNKEFYISRGYTYNDEGVVEKQDKFLKRMSGIFRLRCAIWVAKSPKFINATNPCGLRYGWQWLSSFINLKPESDICATLIHDFFIVCGSEFKKCYGKQFIKIIKLISKDYLQILQNIDEGGPKIRLEVFLQNVLTTGIIEPPSGLVQSRTW
ncbi:hypothetical protein K1T71_010683 [Dendrolimus kikuchii]|uniref:Uncharacterized protein n=1 Tax=Dendrolimus kikuchii TaxID=765133 RepID=A0ACC1CPH3_9NEOP|nr:hypothetical protein K1T71_010683 [Dendrolimus kikuchii]